MRNVEAATQGLEAIGPRSETSGKHQGPVEPDPRNRLAGSLARIHKKRSMNLMLLLTPHLPGIIELADGLLP
jgi:hypothetical protein